MEKYEQFNSLQEIANNISEAVIREIKLHSYKEFIQKVENNISQNFPNPAEHMALFHNMIKEILEEMATNTRK